MEAKISQEEIMQLLDRLYKQSAYGVAKVSPPIEVLADDYLRKIEMWMQRQSSLSTIRLPNAQLLDLLRV